MTDSAQAVVETLLICWNNLDFDGVYSLLDEKVEYHNIPMEPLFGRPAVRAFVESFVGLESVNWQMLHIAVSGNVVLTERLDDFVISGQKVSIPVMGVFEISGGKILKWRDYFDLKTFSDQMPSA